MSAAIDKKYDWYQNPTFVFISYKVASPQVSQDAQVTFDEHSVSLTYNEQTIKIELTN